MNLKFTNLNSFLSENVLTKKDEPSAQDSTQKNEAENRVLKRINLNGMTETYAKTAKENAEKIKALTEELKNLELSDSPTEEEINNFVSTVNSMKSQASEFYEALENLGVRTKCREKDELVDAYTEFCNLAKNKLDIANYEKQKLNGCITSSSVVNFLEAQQTKLQNPASDTDNTVFKKIDINNMTETYAKTAKENAEKIKALTEKLKNLELSNNPTEEEINDFISTVNSMILQANKFYGALENLKFRTKCREKDELVHAYTEFYNLAQNKLDEAYNIK